MINPSSHLFWSHMAISIDEWETYEINHLRRQDTINKKYHRYFILKYLHANQSIMMSSLQSWSINYDMRFLNCWETKYQTIQVQLLSTTRQWAFFNCEVSYCKKYPGCSNVNDGNSLIPYMVGITSTNSFKTNTITGYSSYAKELLDKALAMMLYLCSMMTMSL